MRLVTIFVVIVSMGSMPFNAAVASPVDYENCFIKEIAVGKLGGPGSNKDILEVTFSECDNSSPNGPATAFYENAIGGVVLSAATTRERVDISIGLMPYGTGLLISDIAMTKTADLSNLKHGYNCWVNRVEVASKFRRCSLRSCQSAPKGVYHAESPGIFQMCMAAAMAGKRVKVSYVENDGKRLITYMRFDGVMK